MPIKLKPMIGKQFNELTVLSRTSDRNGKPFYLCSCSCDPSKQFEVRGDFIRTGHTKSCGHILQRGKRPIKVGESWKHWLVLRTIEDDFECRCPAGHIARLSEQQLRRSKAICVECAVIERASKLIGEKVGSYTVTNTTDGRDSRGRVILILTCEVCAATILKSTQQIFVSRTHKKSPMKCASCQAALLAAAAKSPLVLSYTEGKSAIESARRVVFSILPAKIGEQQVDDIVSETMLQLCSKGSSVAIKNLNHLVNAIANRISKRVWRELYASGKFVSPFQSDEGEETDIFETIDTDKSEPESDEDEMRRQALASLTPDEISWMLDYQRRNSRSAAHVAKFNDLTTRCRNAYLATLDNLSEGANATR